jgi:AcrR family transcriptional regulator
MARPRSKSDQEVLAATMRAVSRHGVSALTLAHVAEEAGLAPSTLAERYGSKRALLLAAAKSAARAPGALTPGPATATPGPAAATPGPATATPGPATATPGPAAGTPRDAAVAYLVSLARHVGDRRAFANHLAFLELDVADPEFRAAAADHAAAVLARLESFGLSARAARALYVSYNGALVLWALTGEGSLEDALRADLCHSPDPGGASSSPSA